MVGIGGGYEGMIPRDISRILYSALQEKEDSGAGVISVYKRIGQNDSIIFAISDVEGVKS